MDGEWQVAGGKWNRTRGRITADQHAAKAGSQAAVSWGTERPTQQQVARWQARVEDAAAELAGSAFYRELVQVLQQAILPCPCSARSTDCSAGAASTGTNAQQTADAGSTSHAALLSAVSSLVVYGLGSLEQPGGAHIKCQLALAVRLAAMLPGLQGRPEAYDPVFTGVDCQVLPALGLTVLDRNEGGARVAQAPTLFYLPHCEDSLMDALLAANVEAGTLHNVAILGNRLSIYPERWGSTRCLTAGAAAAATAAGGQVHDRNLPPALQPGQQPDVQQQRQRPYTLLRLCAARAVAEVSIDECGFPVVSAFNDMALHTFHPDWRERLASFHDAA